MKSRKEKIVQAYRLHVTERAPAPGNTGQGKECPVIMLHGGLSTHRYLNDVAALLEKDHTLLLPDLLGFGRSPKPRQAEYSMQQMIECLEYSLQHQLKHKPILFGHSMGANIALKWAAEQPDMFSGLVLSSPLLFEKEHFHRQIASIALEGRWLSNKALAYIVSTGLGLTGLLPRRLAPKLIRSRPKHIAEDLTEQRFFVYRRLLKQIVYRDAFLAEAKRVSIPTWMLVGENDPLANRALDELEALCKTNAHCQLQRIAAAHQLPLEHPEKIARVIESL